MRARTLALAVITVSMTTALLAQSSEPMPAQHRAGGLPAEGVSPERAAEALLRLASLATASAGERLELVERAFDLAARAATAAPRRALALDVGAGRDALPSNPVEESGLDTQSLQARAVAALLELRPARAVELLAAAQRVPLRPPDCLSTIAYDHTPQYEMFVEVMRFFWPDATAHPLYAPQAKTLADAFTRHLAGIESSGEARVALQAIMAAAVPIERRDEALGVWAAALTEVAENRWSFTTHLRELWTEVEAAVRRLQARAPVAVRSVLRGFREFFGRHVAETRCAVAPTPNAFAFEMHVARELDLRLVRNGLGALGSLAIVPLARPHPTVP